jgi:nucleoside-diphosphate-sugar epimerase
VCIVFGAGGALGPDVLHGLLRRVAVVIGVDKQLTYQVDGVHYRQVDLNEPESILSFFEDVRALAAKQGLQMGPCYDLATIQTSATDGADRTALVDGKRVLLEALCESNTDVKLVYMSTAEVYGAPEGAPYYEEHTQEPINVYGRHKCVEERAMLDAHARPTFGGMLHVTALRTWTISMVNYDEHGAVIGTRNYNDPMISLAEKLARSGVKLPVPAPEMQAQFHRSEEVAEVLVHLGEQTLTAASWGRAFNCIGQPTTHGTMRDICCDVFGADEAKFSVGASVANAIGPIMARGIGLCAKWAHQITWLGSTRFGERLPFLYRSTHIDGGDLQAVLGPSLAEPEGTASEDAVRALCEGLLRGGPDALNMKRYAMY